ncbi:MAG: hypothetical protein JXA78_02315 [Anaerolineales bacterium]|nr:hypothetical protein [Anaerolineales bacterium]
MSNPNTNPLTEEQLERLIAELEARLSDWKARLPGHSIPPAMIAEVDELDEQLAQARARLASIRAGQG